ncbi:MAG: insulinase family protein [Myxococcales bacterium]|nr:insulinase family protein [Myxococcales bacterium]
MKLLLRSCIAALALAACTPKTKTDPTVKPGDTNPPGDTQAEVDDSPELALDPAVRTGKLANGLTYFIRKHPKPEQRVMLWLAVNAGSVLEDDDQRGLAHFVEHMAFNGTKRFEKNTMIDFFERSGMDFGADVNAFTSFDETVYMLTVPTDDAKLLSQGYDVLEDWASAVTFDPKEVDKERGVVIEEWRLGRGANQRVFDKQWPVFLAGSKYAERKPIGEKEILETAPVARLKAFYDDWYRPNNMAVIIVGDVDPDQALAEVEKRFADLDNPTDPRERVNVPVPLLDETRVDVQTDKEMSLTQVTLAIKGPVSTYRTENDYREHLVEDLFHGMLRARLDEIRQRPDAPFAFSFSFTTEMGRAVDVFQLFAGAKPGQADAAAKTMLVEVERVRRHGFTPTEFERIKVEHLRDLERNLAEADTVNGRTYAFGLANHFLEGHTMVSRKDELALAKKFMPGVTLEQVNAYAEGWTSRRDRVISAAGASRDKMPTKKDLLAIADGISMMPLQPWEDGGAGGTLMAEAPKAGTVTKKERIEEVGVSVWTLSNGVRVVVKPTDFKNDEILLSAFSPGGHSLASDKAFDSAKWSARIVGQSGVGDHDEVSLGKLLTGKVVSVSPWIDELEEGFRGSASPQDVETLLQLVHLYFTAPRKDPEAFGAWKGQMDTFFKNRDLNPQAVFFDEFGKAMSGDHRRRQPPTSEQLAKVDLDEAFEFYQKRFADAGDFTFVFVGNVDEARLEELAATYLASLPSTGRKEKWRDIKVKPPKGIKEVRVEKGQDPKSFVMLSFHGKAKWSPQTEDDLDMLSEVMSIRLREILREDMSGVYGVFSNGEIERRPKTRYEYFVGFGCSPENAEKLTTAVFDLMDTVKKEGVDAETIDKIKEQRRRGLETDLKENRFWSTQLTDHYRYGTDPRKIAELQKKALERVSSENVQKAARTYLGKQYVDALLLPEGGAATAAATGEGTKAPAKKAATKTEDKAAKKAEAAKAPAKKAG